MRKRFFLAIFILFGMLNLSMFVYAGTNYNRIDVTMLNQDPDPAEPGDYVELRWKIVKEGNSKVDDLNFYLDVEYPLYFDKSDGPDKSVGSWEGWSDEEEYYILYYKLRVDDDAIEDLYTVRLTISQDSTDYARIDEFDIRVGDNVEPKFVLGNIVTSPVKMYSDSEENQLKVTLENIGDENAEVVTTELELPEGFTATYGYSTRANLGTISAGSNSIGIFYIDIDDSVSEGDYEGIMTVNYKEAKDDDNEYKTVELPLKIHVHGKPMFSIKEVRISPEKAIAGSDIDVFLKIENTGSKDAEFVSVRAFKESSQPFEFEEKSDFIGEIKVGKSGEAILKLSIDSDANAKTYLLDLEVRGLYNDEVITENEIVSIKVEEGNKLLQTLMGALIFFIILVVAFFVFRYFRNRK